MKTSTFPGLFARLRSPRALIENEPSLAEQEAGRRELLAVAEKKRQRVPLRLTWGGNELAPYLATWETARHRGDHWWHD